MILNPYWGNHGDYDKDCPCVPIPILPYYLACLKCIVWNMQYAKYTRMFYYIWSHFAGCKPACFGLFCPKMLCSRRYVGGTTGVLISDIICNLSQMYAYATTHTFVRVAAVRTTSRKKKYAILNVASASLTVKLSFSTCPQDVFRRSPCFTDPTTPICNHFIALHWASLSISPPQLIPWTLSPQIQKLTSLSVLY